jgi:toxin ParE1/3/4
VITIRPRAHLDLLEQFNYLAENATLEVAKRYLAAVESTCARIAARPLTGVRYRPHSSDTRRAPVRGFEHYLIFYVPRANGIDIIRVLHGARDIAGILRSDEAI